MANKKCSSPHQEAKSQHGALLVSAENRSQLRGSRWAWLEPRVKGLVDWPDADRQRLMGAVLGSEASRHTDRRPGCTRSMGSIVPWWS